MLIIDEIKIVHNTCVLFSKKDKEYKADFKNHLTNISECHLLGNVYYQSVEERDLFLINDKVFFNITTVVCLLSAGFIVSEFAQSEDFKKIIRADGKTIKFIPVYIDDLHLDGHSLNKINRIRTNALPLSKLESDLYHKALQLLVIEVSMLMQVANELERDVEIAWEKAQRTKTIEAYQQVVDKYPEGKYVKKAKKYRDELVEWKIWKNVLLFGDVASLLEYLTNAPLQLHRNKAIVRIISVELKEEAAKKDVVENDNLGILFDYKSRFRKTGNINEVNDKIFEVFNEPLDIWTSFDLSKNINTEANFLNYKIYTACSSQEIFTYSLFEKYIADLRSKVSLAEKRLIKIKKDLIFYIGSFLLLIITALFFISFLLSIILSVGFVAVMMFYVLRGFWKLEDDINTCQKTLADLKKKKIEFKLSFIIPDKIIYAKIVLLLFNTGEWVEEINTKKLFDYLFLSNEVKNSREEEIKIIENKIPL